jgi:ACS family hexuronate transporter-like MFS transporter
MAFYVTGSLGFLWLALWLAVYVVPERHPKVSPAELAYIRADAPATMQRVAWIPLFGHRQTWAFSIAKFMTDPCWWFYLYWIPGFLQDKHSLHLLEVGPPLVVIYLMADVGSIAGGWFSSSLIRRGRSVNMARKTSMLVCAVCVTPIFAASQVTSLWLAVFLIGLAAAAHQGFSANLYTIVSDTAPRQAVSSIVGIGSMMGALGSVVANLAVGFILEETKSYTIPFLIPAAAYLLALAAIQVILPRLEVMQLGGKTIGEETK